MISNKGGFTMFQWLNMFKKKKVDQKSNITKYPVGERVPRNEPSRKLAREAIERNRRELKK